MCGLFMSVSFSKLLETRSVWRVEAGLVGFARAFQEDILKSVIAASLTYTRSSYDEGDQVIADCGAQAMAQLHDGSSSAAQKVVRHMHKLLEHSLGSYRFTVATITESRGRAVWRSSAT